MEVWNNYSMYVWIWILIALITFIALLFIRAPYGRYASQNWGPQLSNRIGWFIMELPALLLLPFIILQSDNINYPVVILAVVLWLIHYGNRTLIFPFQLKTSHKRMPLFIVANAILFNVVNGIFNGTALANLDHYSSASLLDWNVILGVLIFCFGFITNISSDSILRNLRKPGESGYKVPQGGMYRYISCPNYFGEILEWIGWAFIVWNVAGISFAVWTVANLLPRALQHHKWYQNKFEDYPQSRKAILPGIL